MLDGRGAAPSPVPPGLGSSLALGTLHVLYESTLRADAWERIMDVIAPLVGTTRGMFIRVDRTCPRESVTLAVGVPPDVQSALQRRNLEQDHVWRAVLSLPAGTAHRISDVVPPDTFRDGPLYDSLAVPAGLRHALTAILENTPSFFTTLSFMRDTGEFSDAEVALLQDLVPHVQTAQQIQRRIALGDAGRREALLSFDRAHQPVVVLDRSGYAIYVNADATRTLAVAHGCSLKFGRLHFQSISIQAEFERVVQLALTRPTDVEGLSGTEQQPAHWEVRLPRQGQGAPLALSVVPISRSADRAVLPDGAACVILLFDIETPNALPLSRLAWLYRLTTAESRVCESLFRVGSVDAVAEDLHLTRNTVRSHLKNIYAKFGIVTQGQLMQRLATSFRLVDSVGERDAAD